MHGISILNLEKMPAVTAANTKMNPSGSNYQASSHHTTTKATPYATGKSAKPSHDYVDIAGAACFRARDGRNATCSSEFDELLASSLEDYRQACQNAMLCRSSTVLLLLLICLRGWGLALLF
jgi:hypothetical protein